MRKLFASKNMIVKIALVLALIILIEFTLNCRPVQAKKEAASIGGTLLTPVMKLLVALADGVINIAQSTLFGMDESFQSIDLHERTRNKIFKKPC